MGSSSDTSNMRSNDDGNGVVYGAVAVLHRDVRLLMIRRAEGIRAGGKWCFAGGAVEPGESSGQAIVREMAEEVGLAVRAVERIWRWTSPNGKLVLDRWQVEALSDRVEPNPAEVAEVRWLTPSQIRRIPDVLPGLLQFLDEFYPPSTSV